MSVAPKKRIKDIKGIPVAQRVEEALKKDKEYATHVKRLMLDLFGVKESEIKGSFKDWKPSERVSLYVKIRKALEDLVAEGKAEKKKDGKAYYYWWKE
ncbi:MAG: hypothetical protein ACREBU_09910 [Nitrososphaera sp.]